MDKNCFFDCFPVRKPNLYCKFVDALFYLCLLLAPLSHVAIDRETGEGAFLKYFYMVFFVLAAPAWNRYFRKFGKIFPLFMQMQKVLIL